MIIYHTGFAFKKNINFPFMANGAIKMRNGVCEWVVSQCIVNIRVLYDRSNNFK